MGAPDLLARLQALGVRLSMDGEALIAEPRSALTDDARAMIRAHKAELVGELNRAKGYLPTPALGRCRDAALKMLADSPAIYRAGYADAEADALNVIVSIGIRDLGTCELVIPKSKYDGFALMDLIRKYTEQGELTQFLLASETKH